MIGDEFSKRWQDQWVQQGPASASFFPPQISREEFDALKKEVELMKDLLKAAKIYDEKNNEPHCEMDEKVALLKKIAEFVGVNLDEIFKK